MSEPTLEQLIICAVAESESIDWLLGVETLNEMMRTARRVPEWADIIPEDFDIKNVHVDGLEIWQGFYSREMVSMKSLRYKHDCPDRKTCDYLARLWYVTRDRLGEFTAYPELKQQATELATRLASLGYHASLERNYEEGDDWDCSWWEGDEHNSLHTVCWYGDGVVVAHTASRGGRKLYIRYEPGEELPDFIELFYPEKRNK